MGKSISSVGIIGQGAFGKLALSLAPKDITRHTFDLGDTDNQFATVARCDIVLLAVPLSAYENVLTKLKPYLRAEALLVDVCSVKLKPAELIEKLLPEHKNVLLTHPLFGPETYRRDDSRPTLVICSKPTGRSSEVVEFCRNELSMNIAAMTPEEHDREMALVHALTFFIARGLRGIKMDGLTLETPSFRHIKQLAHLDAVHSQELFETIERGNPYAAEARTRIMSQLEQVNTSLRL
jgi:prephenate dehydrogenase